MRSARLQQKIEETLRDPSPEMKDVKDHGFLKRRVRVTLDGVDVTGRCKAFSIPAGRVQLFVENEAGRKVLEYTCGCGTVPRRRIAGTYQRRARWCCVTCRRPISVAAKVEIKSGTVRVEVNQSVREKGEPC